MSSGKKSSNPELITRTQAAPTQSVWQIMYQTNISLGIFLIISSKISNPHFTIELKRKCQRVVNFKRVPGPSSISPYEINGQEMTVI